MCDDVRSIDSRQRQYSALHCIAPVLWHVSVCFSGCSWILAFCATFYGRSYFSCTLILKSPAISGSSVPDRMLSTCAFCACACSGSKGNQETQLSLTNLRRVYKSVKVTEHGTIPYVRCSFLLCNSNFVFKTRRFLWYSTSKMSWSWNPGQRSLKVIESGTIIYRFGVVSY